MIRPLAEFIMRGRVSAISIALIGSWVPILTQATLGLVTLRKGWQEGILITLWAVLPTLVGLWVGDVGRTLVYASVGAILVSYIVAGVLRATISWPATLTALVACSTLASLLVYVSVPDISGEVTEFFKQLISGANEQSDAKAEAKIQELLTSWNAQKITGMVAFWIAISALLGVLVARWWQAMLYNPGGFRDEFQNIRLTPLVSGVSLLAALYSINSGSDYEFWTNLFILPLLVAGLGLVHCALTKYNSNTGVVVVVYLALLLIPPLALFVAFAGATDVWLDYRKRFNLMQR